MFKKQSMNQQHNKKKVSMVIESGDPLAQTFMVSETGGCFLTKLDLFFGLR